MAAQILAMRFFAARGNAPEAVAAAEHVVALDPDNIDASRNLARTALSLGAVGPAFRAYSSILKRNGSGREALTHVARYASAANDPARFTAALLRLNGAPPQLLSVHAPAIPVSAGRLDART